MIITKPVLALLLIAAQASAATVTVTPPPYTVDPPAITHNPAPFTVRPPAITLTVPTVKGDKGDPGPAVDLTSVTTRLTALEAAVAALKAGAPATPTPPVTPPTPPVPAPPPPVASAECTTAAIMGSAVRPAATVDPANSATWPKVEITVGPTSRCARIAQALSTLSDVGPLDLTVTLDPSVEYVDDTSSHFWEGKGHPIDWPPFEQTIVWKTLIRSKPGSGKLAVLRSSAGSLYYGKGILNLSPAWSGADQTLEGIHLIGPHRGDVDGRLTNVWMEPNEVKATLTLRNVEMEGADTCILNGGINHSIVLVNVYVHDCGSGSGLTHNIYLGHAAKVTVRNLLSVGVNTGHLFKSRAAVHDMENVRLIDGANGSSSYAIDFPNGGAVTIRNLVTAKGVASANAFSMAFGEEGDANGGPNPNPSLSVTGWTMAAQVRDGTTFGGAAGLWNASNTAAGKPLILPTLTGLSVFGVTADRLLRMNAGFQPPPAFTPLSAMPALDMTSPVRLP